MVLLLASTSTLLAQADAGPSIVEHRNHVIFVIDNSGTVLKSPGLGRLKVSLERDLAPILTDGQVNGFEDRLFDPAQDSSSAFVFSYSDDDPFFGPPKEGKLGFMRNLWAEEKGHSYTHLADRATQVPPPGYSQTALTAALELALWQVQWEMTRRPKPWPAFTKTYLVLVTDGKGNTTKDVLDELVGLHGRSSPLGFNVQELRQNRETVAARVQLRANYFSIRSAETSSALVGIPLGTGSNLKALIRKLVPHQLDGLDGLLRLRPERRTLLKRRSGGRYSTTLQLAARPAREGLSYRLTRLEYQPPGAVQFENWLVQNPEEVFQKEVILPREEVERAVARFRLSFVRLDPVYGQAVQSFTEEVFFRAEPNRRVLGLFSVPDWMMSILPFLTQGQIADFAAYLLFFALLAFLYWLLFPPPRVVLEWVSGVAGRKEDSSRLAIPVDLDLAKRGQEDGIAIALGTVRFLNAAQRIRGLFRAERRFAIHAGVRLEAPESVVLGKRLPLGLSAAMVPEVEFASLSHGSEVAVSLRPASLRDFLGDWHQEVECDLVVEAEQARRSFWQSARRLQPYRESFSLLFLPETPGLEASLEPARAPRPTGATEERPFPEQVGDRSVPGWLIVPHMRDADEGEAPPEFRLRLRNTAGRICARTASARLTIFLIRVDGVEPLRLVAEPAGSSPAGAGYSLERIESEDGAGHWEICGIRSDPTGVWPVAIPIQIAYGQLPLPLAAGDDYVVEVQLSPAEGQTWPTVRARHGVRIGPDPRRAELLLSVATEPSAKSRDLAWQSIAQPGDQEEIAIEVGEPVLWGLGVHKPVSTLVKLRIDNLARSGSGEVTLRLLSGAQVISGPEADEGFEPGYKAEREAMVEIAVEGKPFPLSDLRKEVEWTILSEDPADRRPILWDLRFNPNAIDNFNRQIRKYPYECRLPFSCRIRQSDREEPVEIEFHIILRFTVERSAGDHVLAIDFGTSAVVAAFEQSLINVENRNAHGFSAATLSLQGRYLDVLRARDGGAVEDEKRFPNVESSTRFIPSHLVWRSGKRIGSAEFVDLPSSWIQLLNDRAGTIYHLKSLILRGERVVPNLSPNGRVSQAWLDRDDSVRDGQPPVDGVIESAYRNLFENYIEPLLKVENRDEYLDRVILACPNNFTLGHLQRLRKVLEGAFPGRFQFDFLSESKAVAIYCCCPPHRFFPPEMAEADTHHVLVYDLGAGTLDLTYARLTWGSEEEGHALKDMEVLFQSGLPVAGHRLDVALARVLDSKIRFLCGQLAASNVQLRYVYPIVRTDEDEQIGGYPLRMLPVKRALSQLKVDLSQTGLDLEEDVRLHVPVSAAPDVADGILLLEGSPQDKPVGRALQNLGMTTVQWANRTLRQLGIPLTPREIFGHPSVEGWLAQVTDEVMADFAAALSELDIHPQIDAVILSGRTSLFPPVRPRLLAAIERHLGMGPSDLHLVALDSAQRKEAVALGCLSYSLLLRQEVGFRDRSVWARYGVIYETGRGRRFKEFFGFATKEDPARDLIVEEEGVRTVLFRRRESIACIGPRIDIAITFSRDPNRDVRDGRLLADKFTIIYSIGGDVLKKARRGGGTGAKVEIEMWIDRQGQLGVKIDPGRLEQEITDLAYRPSGDLPQGDWPYQPLTGVVEEVTEVPAALGAAGGGSDSDNGGEIPEETVEFGS